MKNPAPLLSCLLALAAAGVYFQGRGLARELASENGLGLKVREAIFPAGSSPVGARMRLGDVSCQVIGLVEERGQGGGGVFPAGRKIMHAR